MLQLKPGFFKILVQGLRDGVFPKQTATNAENSGSRANFP